MATRGRSPQMQVWIMIAGMNSVSTRATASLLITLALAGCGGGNVEPPVAGPCVHLYQDEVLHLESAGGRSTGAVIPALELRGFSVDGMSLSLDEVISQRSSFLQRDGDILRCTLPCGWGVQAGEWEFSARAEGYEWTEQAIEARYAMFVGGCPSYDDEGTRTSIQLDEANGG